MNIRNASVKKIAFSGVMAALSTVILVAAGLIPIAAAALPALAGCLAIPVVVEAGKKWAVSVYSVSGFFALFLTADKEAALLYLLFFGYYPILYAVLGRIRKRIPRMIVKLLVFNAAVILESLISVYILGIPFESIEMLGAFFIPILLIAANGVFIIYDYALDGLIAMYIQRFHAKFRNMFKF